MARPLRSTASVGVFQKGKADILYQAAQPACQGVPVSGAAPSLRRMLWAPLRL
jgi:hypothetical protein